MSQMRSTPTRSKLGLHMGDNPSSRKLKYEEKPSSQEDLNPKPSLPKLLDRKEMERVALAASTCKIDHSAILSRKEGSDVTISVGGKILYAHRAVVEIRCPNLFFNAVKKKTIKKASVFLEVEDKKNVISPKAFSALLKFLYSSNVKFFGMDSSDVLDLMVLAKIYECFNLSKLCQLFLLSMMDESRWFNILKESRRLELEEATIACKIFAKRNFEDLVIQKSGMIALGIDLFHEIVQYVVLPSEEQTLLDLDTVIVAAHQEIQEDFEKICTEMFRADASFKTDGEPLLFHSVVVFNQSTKLSQLFNPETSSLSLADKPDQISDDAIQFLLKFIYYAYDNIDPFLAYQLSQFSLDFSISKLHELCEKRLFSIDKSNVLYVLRTARQKIASGTAVGAYLQFLKEVRKQCLFFITEKFDLVDTNGPHDQDTLIDLLTLAQASAQKRHWRPRKRPFQDIASSEKTPVKFHPPKNLEEEFEEGKNQKKRSSKLIKSQRDNLNVSKKKSNRSLNPKLNKGAVTTPDVPEPTEPEPAEPESTGPAEPEPTKPAAPEPTTEPVAPCATEPPPLQPSQRTTCHSTLALTPIALLPKATRHRSRTVSVDQWELEFDQHVLHSPKPATEDQTPCLDSFDTESPCQTSAHLEAGQTGQSRPQTPQSDGVEHAAPEALMAASSSLSSSSSSDHSVSCDTEALPEGSPNNSPTPCLQITPPMNDITVPSPIDTKSGDDSLTSENSPGVSLRSNEDHKASESFDSTEIPEHGAILASDSEEEEEDPPEQTKPKPNMTLPLHTLTATDPGRSSGRIITPRTVLAEHARATQPNQPPLSSSLQTIGEENPQTPPIQTEPMSPSFEPPHDPPDFLTGLKTTAVKAGTLRARNPVSRALSMPTGRPKSSRIDGIIRQLHECPMAEEDKAKEKEEVQAIKRANTAKLRGFFEQESQKESSSLKRDKSSGSPGDGCFFHSSTLGSLESLPPTSQTTTSPSTEPNPEIC